MRQLRTNKVALCAVFTALAMILSYVESMIPNFFPAPGMKLGLTNLLVVFALYCWSAKEAIVINIMRIFLVGFLFGNPYSIAYSLSGCILSFLVMLLLKKTGKFSVVGISMAGGVFHNVGQIIIAYLIVSNFAIVSYLPLLIIGGLITGFLIGILSGEMLKRLGEYLRFGEGR
ncbi:MAG: Gx transporter family protein [Lachnospiraceae bacterium]|nr:Gx transporter family protein [Lachnospiraceae bacterium]